MISSAKVAVLAITTAVFALAKASTPVPSPSAATFVRGSLIAKVGDTLVPRFATQTDTVLVVHKATTNYPLGYVTVAKCGTGAIYLRLYGPNNAGKLGSQLYGDSVSVPVCQEAQVPQARKSCKAIMTANAWSPETSWAQWAVDSLKGCYDGPPTPLLEKP